MRAHADDLRAEGAAELADIASRDYRDAELEPHVRALCDFAVQISERPASGTADDVDALRAHGWSDPAIHDAIQVIGYFNYVNRVADSVGIDEEPEWRS